MAKQLVVPTIFSAVDKFTGPVNAMQKSIKAFTNASPTIGFLKSVGGAADTAFDKIVNLKNAAVIGLGGAALVKGYDMIKNIAEQGDEIQKTAQITGFATKSIQELQFAAMRENVANETLIGSFQKLNKNVGDLKLGSGSLQTVLKTTNPALLAQLRHVKNSEQAFDLLVTAIDKAPNTFKKTQLAQAAFGKSGTDMLKLIATGPAGIAALRKEANDLGVVIADKDLEAFAKFADANDNLQATLKGLMFTVGGGLLPLFQSGVEKVTNWAKQNRELIKTKVTEWAKKIGAALEWTVNHLDSIITGLKWFLILLIATKAISMLATGAMWAYSAAVIGYNIAIGIAGALTGVANVAIGQSAVALKAYNATMWIASAATTAWGAAVNFGLLPLALIAAAIGLVIYFAIRLVKHWSAVSAAFQNGGILQGIITIGKVLLDAVILPVQKILQLVGKLTSADWAKNAAAGLDKFRGGLGLNTTVVDKFMPAQKPAEFSPLLNPEQRKQQGLLNMIQTNNANVNLNINDPNNRTTAYTDSDFVKIALTSTHSYGQ